MSRTPLPEPHSTGKRTLPELADRARRGERLVVVTAYDAPSARLADEAGMDMILVGGTRRAIVVADMPFGSYQVSEDAAIANAVRFVQEAGADAVKLEGAGRSLTRVGGIVAAGIPVMGHIGLTPQSATQLGGYKAQGRTAAAARRLVGEAMALERAGCFSIVLEAIPAFVAERITAAVGIPTIGIGAGAGCSGQVLVWHDLLGLLPEAPPRFVKQYADTRGVIRDALARYVAEVREGVFPGEGHTYGMPDAERYRFETESDAPAARRGRDRDPVR
jgi:3-methyl-2-oxobutanoate hydroxymethyltransferase